MKHCSFFFLSNNFFQAKNLRFLLLIQFLCGGSESLCQRSVLKIMTYDMGKEVNSERALYTRAARYKKKQILGGKDGFTNNFPLL